MVVWNQGKLLKLWLLDSSRSRDSKVHQEGCCCCPNKHNLREVRKGVMTFIVVVVVVERASRYDCSVTKLMRRFLQDL